MVSSVAAGSASTAHGFGSSSSVVFHCMLTGLGGGFRRPHVWCGHLCFCGEPLAHGSVLNRYEKTQQEEKPLGRSLAS